jgi:hypothetical protein
METNTAQVTSFYIKDISEKEEKPFKEVVSFKLENL